MKLLGHWLLQGRIQRLGVNHNIFPNKSNVSIDLRPVLLFENWLKTAFGINRIIPFEQNYGTAEVKTGNPNDINNIFDMRNMLEKNLPIWIEYKMFKKYNVWEKVATMDIYEDGRDMLFTTLIQNPTV